MKTLLVLFWAILLCYVPLALMAQADSTFIRYYYPNTQTNPNWYYYPRWPLLTANVFETHENNIALQTLGEFHTPEPEFAYAQSPILVYNRTGILQCTHFGPVFDQSLVPLTYLKIIADDSNGYLALCSYNNGLYLDGVIKLDPDFQYVSSITLPWNETDSIIPTDILRENDGYLIAGFVWHVVGTSNQQLVIKYDFDFNVIWYYSDNSYLPSDSRIIKTSDNGYLFSSSSSAGVRHLKISPTGDSLWCVTPGTHSLRIIETDSHYYGFNYHCGNIMGDSIFVYVFGQDFSIPNPDSPIFILHTNNSYYEDRSFSVIRTSDQGILLLAATPQGELLKFDSNFNLLWTVDNVPNESIGYGRMPLIELANGDIVYCVYTAYGGLTDKFVLVRTAPDGTATSVDDEQEPIPDIFITSYPNPFVNNAVISYNLPKQTRVKLDVFNIKGQRVRSLENKVKDSGSQTINWDGTNDRGLALPTGIYFCRLVTPDQVHTLKLVLLN